MVTRELILMYCCIRLAPYNLCSRWGDLIGQLTYDWKHSVTLGANRPPPTAKFGRSAKPVIGPGPPIRILAGLVVHIHNIVMCFCIGTK